MKKKHFYCLLIMIFVGTSNIIGQTIEFRNNHLEVRLKVVKQNDSCYTIEKKLINISKMDVFLKYNRDTYNSLYAIFEEGNRFNSFQINSRENDERISMIRPNDTITSLIYACFIDDFKYSKIKNEKIESISLFISYVVPTMYGEKEMQEMLKSIDYYDFFNSLVMDNEVYNKYRQTFYIDINLDK
ncbi:MAG: hypothetical protein GX587_07980 [Bacteroidales bacterium]|nr:hypothetical protein [Bacteroidales bacterium]